MKAKKFQMHDFKSYDIKRVNPEFFKQTQNQGEFGYLKLVVFFFGISISRLSVTLNRCVTPRLRTLWDLPFSTKQLLAFEVCLNISASRRVSICKCKLRINDAASQIKLVLQFTHRIFKWFYGFLVGKRGTF